MARKLRHGDKIFALGLIFTIGEIYYQELIDDIYDVEFIDINGGYHHWKQIYDGGQVIFKD